MGCWKNKITLLAICCTFFSVNILLAQEKYIDKKGQITFEASEKAFEEVKATNKSTTVILDVGTGKIASVALVKEFRFKNALMEEHFNENYVDSDNYPKAKFSGEIIDFNNEGLSENKLELKLNGTLEFHGEKKEISSVVYVSENNGIIFLSGKFTVTPQDFAIEIPKIVRNKIAKEVHVSFDFQLKKK
ncbi:YceI family protein [Aureibaculum sp. 2210JD6-5]|uniref:YceI family protein n=1 Tax=Aureibaculum sp. 2210JD6-5 TaxID=3103957 RepID=UPI002AAC5A60|nr:YceI family protein [Aureibaculum sp. 2210JD6-5]MDY7394826.1 YceI family protein [Aureibaculum sp. 2210JD6-5]